MRIVFCGDCFPASRDLLRERLRDQPQDELIVSRERNLRNELSQADVVIPMMTTLDRDLLSATRARLVQQWGSGLECVDLEAAAAHNIWVARVPTVQWIADSVAEHVLLLTLALLRHLPVGQANVRQGILGAPMGQTLAGRTVCLYGLGVTAKAIAQRLRGFDVRLVGITRSPSESKASEFGLHACYGYSDRAAALAVSHILIVCLQPVRETHGHIDAAALAALPAGALLVNAARGALVDYDAVYQALASGHLGGAGLDAYWSEPIFPDDPILAIPNVIATPQVAGVTDRSYGHIADAVARNIERLRRGQAPLHRVA
jgi:phosphoglycerate dehydrogenase-like enzyme